MAAKYISSKDPSELIPITFDFSGLVTSIDTIASIAISVISGTDPNVATMLYSSAQKTGTNVIQLVQNGVNNAAYKIRADIVSGSEKYAIAAIFNVKTL